MLPAARQYWLAAGASAIALDRIQVVIGNLPQAVAGQTLGTQITLSTDGAGWGWFVDTTPALHEEFGSGSSPEAFQALPGSAADGRLDLLTVLIHEMGHALGLDHADEHHDLMAAVLSPSQRRVLDADVAEDLRAAGSYVAPGRLSITRVADLAGLPAQRYAWVANPQLTNGDFGTDGTTAWIAEGDVRTQGEQATLVESFTRHTHLAQAFTVNADDRALMFTLAGNNLRANTGASVGTSVGASAGPGDAFEAALLDANTGLPVVGTTALSRSDALLNIQTDGTERLAAGVRKIVNLDGSATYIIDLPAALTAANGSAPVLLSFDLLGFGAAQSSVTLRDVKLVSNPLAFADTATLDEDTAATGNLLDNDVALAAAISEVLLVDAPAHGNVVLGADGRYTYTPAANYFGADSFSYRLVDADGRASNTATVRLAVRPVNDAPVVQALGEQQVAAGQTRVLLPLVGATDVEGDALSVEIVAAPNHGGLVLNADGSLSYTAPAAYVGGDSFSYRITDNSRDGAASSAVQTVRLVVTSGNTAPVARSGVLVLAEDGSAALDLRTYGSDAEGDKLVPTIVQGPSHGTLALQSDGSYVYTPQANFNGTDMLRFTLSDGLLVSEVATLSFTVTAVNDAPTVADRTVYTEEDAALRVDLLQGAIDVDGDLVSATIVVGPANGGLVFNSDGSYTYTPRANFFGTDSFSYRVSDNSSSGSAQSGLATVSIVIKPINDAPTAKDITVTGQEDETIGLTSSKFAATDIDSTVLRIRITSLPTEGSLQRRDTKGKWVAVAVGNEFSADQLDAGVLRFVPVVGASGGPGYTQSGYGNRREHYARLGYLVTDGSAQSAEAKLTLDIAALADAPRLQMLDTQASGAEDSTIALPRLSAQVGDVDGSEVLVLTLTGLPVGSVLGDGSRSLTITADQPVANITGWNTVALTLRAPTHFSGTLQLQVQATAIETATGGRATMTQDLTVQITAVVDAPVLTLTARSTGNTGSAVSRELVSTSWETVQNRNRNATVVAGGPGLLLEGWSLVKPTRGGQNMFEIWSSSDSMRNTAGSAVTVQNAPDNGNNWLQLNDARGQGHQTLGIERAIATLNGAVYSLSLDYAGALGLAQDKTRIGIYLDGQLIANYANTSSLTALNWQTLSYQFTGNGQIRRLCILLEGGTTVNNGRGAMIDDIRVVETLPASDRVVYGLSGGAIMLPVVQARLTDTDGSETLTVELLDLRAGTVVSDGTRSVTVDGSGLVNISGWNLATLRLVPPSGFTGGMQLSLRATATEVSNGATTSTMESFTVHVLSGIAVATPVGVNPFVSASGNTTMPRATGNTAPVRPVLAATPLIPETCTVRLSLPVAGVLRTWQDEEEARRKALSDAWLAQMEVAAKAQWAQMQPVAAVQ